MKIQHRPVAVLLVIGCALMGLYASRAQNSPQAVLQDADKLFHDKSYAGALKSYEALLKDNTLPADRKDDVQYRICVSLGKTQQWDQALEHSVAFVKEHQGTVWEPRGLYWLGRLYLGVPHQVWKVGSKMYRGNDVPKTTSAEKPERVYVSQQDDQNARDAMEAARVFFPKYRQEFQTSSDEISLNFDLARLVGNSMDYRWAIDQKWTPLNDPLWKINPDDPYDPKWPLPKRVLTLYAQIEQLSAKTEKGVHVARELLAKALWIREYQRIMPGLASKRVGDKVAVVSYPYQKLNPTDSLNRIVNEMPDDPIREQAQYTIGLFLATDSRFKDAVKEFNKFIKQCPKSKWVTDARWQLQNITWPQLSIYSYGNHLPGEQVKANVSLRNVRTIHFSLYRVKYADVLGRDDVLKDVDNYWNNYERNFGDYKSGGKYLTDKIADWNHTTIDKGDYQYKSESISLPVKETGAYVLVGDSPKRHSASVILISNITLTQKMHKDGGLFFAADAKTGKPVPNASLIVRQWWWEPSSMHTAFDRVTTNADGLCTVPLKRGANRTSFRMTGLAQSGENYAQTDQGYTWDYGDNPDAVKGYTITDRAVYRPMQTVQFREILMRKTGGDIAPLMQKAIKIYATDPKGQQIYTANLKSNDFGSISGSFSLASTAPLGEYSIRCEVTGETTNVMESGGNRFRVEEYKKPEFEVTVKPESDRVRLGEPTTAKVIARYYFGAPVPNAKVSYKVYRNYWAQSYQFPRPFDFLYAYNNAGNYDTNYRNGDVISQGEAKTDAQGEAKVTFPTSNENSRWGQTDMAYTIEADVMDASRRTISGSGQVKATKRDVAVFMNYPHGYATKGERVDVEIMTLNPSDQPVSVTGKAQVWLQPEKLGDKPKLVHEEELKTDTHGRSYLKWTTDRGGYFKLAFVTRDTREEVVEGSTMLFVQGPELQKSRFLFSQVFMGVENQYYEEGQTAKVLLVTPEDGCTLLLTREANNEILSKQVLYIPGRSFEITLPLAARDVPNVYYKATMVRNNQGYQAEQELFVPPVRRFNNIEAAFDKDHYQPGEKAKIHLTAKDWQNKPLRTELSLAVTDASLNYIQKDYQQDIRTYYYGNRRPVSVTINGSLGYQMSGAEQTEVQIPQQTHEWVLPEGMGMLEDWPGLDKSLNRYLYGGYYNSYGMHASNGIRRLGMQVGGGGGYGGFAPMSKSASALGMDADSLSTAGPAGEAGAALEMESLRDGNGRSDSSAFGRKDEKLAVKPGSGSTASGVRTNFADTAFWTPAVVTNADGTADVEVIWPDNLTQWRAKAIGTTTGAQVGFGVTTTVTKKDLIVRLQAPRFFVERDVLVLSANVHNYLDKDVSVNCKLNIDNDTLELVPLSATKDPLEAYDTMERVSPERVLNIPKNSEKRLDWAVKVKHAGTVKIRMSATTAGASDAAELSFPVIVHGVERFLAQGGVMRDTKTDTVTINLPEARKPGGSSLMVQLNPSLGAVMLDSLPYLLDYPYGCVEQTVSRFVPAAIISKIFADSGVSLEDLKKRAAVLEENAKKGGASAAVENSPYSYPGGRPGSIDNEHLSRYQRILHNPVFDSAELKKIVTEGLSRVQMWQHADGGWGWWPGDDSDPYMSSYALYGMLTAKDADYSVDAGMLERGLNFLRDRFLQDDNFHRMAYEARVLAMDKRYRDAIKPLVTGRLYTNRERLTAYSKALLAMALQDVGDAEKAKVLMGNIETTAKVDQANGTVNWDGDGTGWWWCWWNNKVQTNATVLQAYMKIQPDSPMAPMMVKWLVNNRRGNTWYSTRETAEAVYSLAKYVMVNKELSPDYTVTLDYGGKVTRKYTITKENALLFDNQFEVPDELLKTGDQQLTITKEGPGALYYTAYTRYFSLEEPIKATSNEIAVSRRYFKLVPGTASGQPLDKKLELDRPNPFLTHKYESLDSGAEWVGAQDTQAGPRFERVEIKDGDTVTSGDQIEVELQVESKNDYEYLVFEDMKPSGCESVEVRSGIHAGQGVYSNIEFRDQKTAFFVSFMPQGRRNLIYRLRAEQPGRFHVLPVNGYAMYAPDVRAISDEGHINVRDEEK